MVRSRILSVFFVAALTVFGLSMAFAKEVVNLPNTNLYLGTPGQQLQQAVNDPANAGKIIHLAPGTYTLDPAVGPSSYGGRLSLQQGMEIVGENEYVDCDGDGIWDPIGCPSGPANPNDQFTEPGSETIIDGSLVTALEDGAPIGLIRAGLDNTISRLTIIGPDTTTVIGDVYVNLHDNGIIRAVVTDNVIDGGSRGIYCQNPIPLVAGTSALVVLRRNIIRNIPNPGIHFINSNTQGNIWEGIVEYNRIYSNRIGMFLLGNQSSFARTSISSFRNVIESNNLGILVQAGQDGGGQGQTPTPGNNNQFSLMSREDTIRNNMGDAGNPASGLGGGVVAMAGSNSTAGRPWSFSNLAVLQFLDTEFQNNTDPQGVSQLRVYGYWTNQNRTVSGYPTDNQALATVRLPNCDLNPDGFFRFDSVPDYPNAGNKAVLNFEQCADPTSLITISSSFNGTPINPGNFVWFSGNFKASGLRTDVPTTIYFTDSTITVNGEPHPVASGAITFDPAASCASTEFTLGGWTTVLPTAGSDEILLSGLRLPAIEGIPGGATVSWSARFFSDQPGVKLNWKWGAAVYSSTIDYNAMNVKPTHTNACGIANSDHAGTPETIKAYLTSGARGGGGSNYTGGWTGTLSVTPKPY